MTGDDKGNTDLEFGGPAIYRIVVQGLLSEEWSSRLAGLEIAAAAPEASSPRTELCGMVRDQAELSGVLETLHDLHLSIVKVEQVDESGCARTRAAPTDAA